MSDLIVLAASALGVLALIGIALAMGFRDRARIDDAQLAALAAAEGARVEASIVGADGRAGLARLSDGRWLAARAMADGVGARVFAAARLRATRTGLTIGFDDIGYPDLHVRLDQPAPAWLLERCA
jgi:hypothetical protein